MVRAAFVLLSVLAGSWAQAAERKVDLARWAAGLPLSFAVSGVKTEPTYLAAIEIRRDGDRFLVRGGAPAWAERAVETLSVAPDGALCRASSGCGFGASPGGYLATAGLVAAARRGQLSGSLPVLAFGERQVVCVPGERLGIVEPILDPCFDLSSGAAIAQRSRFNGRFDGPTLEATSLRITYVELASSEPLD